MDPVKTVDGLERALLWGEVWVRVATLPRLIAESWRVLLTGRGIPSAVKTPWQWVTTTNVIELEAGVYQGNVGLFVPEAQCAEALEELGLLEAGEATLETSVD